MLYRVKTLGPRQQVDISVVAADTEQQARRQLESRGLAVLSVVRAGWLHSLRNSGQARFPLLLFSQELLALVASGVSVVEAIETLVEKEARPAVRDTLHAVLTQLQEGKPLSLALETLPQAFPPLYVATVRASEKTGALQEALGRYITYASQLETLRARLVSAAVYPVMLIGVSLLVILFLMGYVVPRFAHIYEDVGGDLPFMSRVLLQIGQGIEAYGGWLLAGLISLVIALGQGGGRWLRAQLLRQLWRIPALGEILRVFQLTRLYRTLGMLLRGGVAAVPAMEMVGGLLDAGLAARLREAAAAVREGQPLSQAFAQVGLTTPVALRMTRVGERAGNMGEMLERVAVFHDEELARRADWLTRLLGPVLMLIMGLLIGAIVVLMYLPIFQLAESIR